MDSQRNAESVALRRWVRGALLLAAGGLIAVFVTAIRLSPYDDAGRPLRLETHRQLGLPACKFYEMFHKPCPACGLTTSFSLLMHGDVFASLRANFVGTLMALFFLGAIPWAIYSALRGRYWGIPTLEPVILAAVGVIALLLLFRWAIVMLL